jgi:hypothetical protein
MVISPIDWSACATARIPGARTPSSFVTRIRNGRCGAPAGVLAAAGPAEDAGDGGAGTARTHADAATMERTSARTWNERFIGRC